MLQEVSAANRIELPWLHGGDLVARQLASEGVDLLFTLTGGHISPIYDGLRHVGVRLVDFRHEQAAVHAADAYARICRKPAVAALTAGPGVTGGVTAIANALYARSPVVVLGGRNPFAIDGAGNLQEAPQLELLKPITKNVAGIHHFTRIPDILRDAFARAFTPRYGPAYVDIPMDVLLTRSDAADAPALIKPPYLAEGHPRNSDVKKIAQLLGAAQRPVVLVGTGAYWDNAEHALSSFVEIYKAPVYLNGMARGLLGRNNPYVVSKGRKSALAKADLVLALGIDFDFRLDYGQLIAPEAQIIQVDPDTPSLGRNRSVMIGVPTSTVAFLTELLQIDGLFGRSISSRWLDDLKASEQQSRHKQQEAVKSGRQSPIHPMRLCAEVAEYLDEDAVVVGDGGDIVSAYASVHRAGKPGHWMDPGPFGCLGVGAPFAMGARLARPQEQVAVIFGDGAFGFNGFEYDSAVRAKLPFVGILGNDGAWGEMRTFHADLFGSRDLSAQHLSQDTRYEKVVEALGGFGRRIEDAEDIRPALDEAFASGVPALLNVILDPTYQRRNESVSGRLVAQAYGGDHNAFRRD